MSNDPRKHRAYDTSELPFLGPGVGSEDRREILLTMYGEICNSWRMLTDVRFKLLGLVPTVSVALLITLLNRKKDEGLSRPSLIAVSVFGLLVTLALFLYEIRNSQLYDDLISRGRKIEEELGIDTGQFLGRRTTTNPLIKHDVAVNVIYSTAIGGWIFALLAMWLGWL